MIGILLFLVGWVVGLFLWSNILGSIFATLPLRMQLMREGVVKTMNWSIIVIPIIWSSIALIIASIYSTEFLYGSLVAGVMIFFQIHKLKAEATESFLQSSEYKEYSEKVDRSESIDNHIARNAPKQSRKKQLKNELLDWDTIKKGEGNGR